MPHADALMRVRTVQHGRAKPLKLLVRTVSAHGPRTVRNVLISLCSRFGAQTPHTPYTCGWGLEPHPQGVDDLFSDERIGAARVAPAQPRHGHIAAEVLKIDATITVRENYAAPNGRVSKC